MRSLQWVFVLFAIISSTIFAASPTTTTLTTQISEADFAAPVSLMAFVSPTAASGKVMFFDGADLVGVASLDSGRAAATVRFKDTGNRSIRAIYSGDSQFDPSTSPSLNFQVTTHPAIGFKIGPTPFTNIQGNAIGEDFDRDGRDDFLLIRPQGLEFFHGNGDGTFGERKTTSVGVSGIRLPFYGIVEDLDADGALDIVARSTGGNGPTYVYWGIGDGTFSAPLVMPQAADAEAKVADFNNDGFPDIAFFSSYDERQVARMLVFLNKRNRTFQRVYQYDLPGSGLFEVGDLNNDGNTDIVFQNRDTSSTSIPAHQLTVFLGDGKGQFSTRYFEQQFLDPLATGILALALCDLNRDGRLDLVVALKAVWIFAGNGDGSFETPTRYNGQPPPSPLFGYFGDVKSLKIIDVNGDGFDDVVQGHGPSNATLSIEVFPGRGDGSLGPTTLDLFPSTAEGSINLGTADFNGDGRVDLLARWTAVLGEGLAPVIVPRIYGAPEIVRNGGASWAVVVRNESPSMATSGVVMVQFRPVASGGPDFRPMSGSGWTCSSQGLCTRSDSLPPGASYPTINVTTDSPAVGVQEIEVFVQAGGGGAPIQQRQIAVQVVEPSYTNNCAVSLRMPPAFFTNKGGASFISGTAGSGCFWEVTTVAPWIKFDARYERGNQSIEYTVEPNDGPARTATINTSTQNFTITQAAGPVSNAPAIAWVANAFSERPAIAPNIWVQVRGSNLAPSGKSRIWDGADFINNRMPTGLDGVSVTINGKPAYIYYISDTQLNVLTPPDPLPSDASVQVTVNGVVSNVVSVAAQPKSPSFFELVSVEGIHWVYGRHSNDDSIVGPTLLYPGYSRPLQPGEAFYVAATGFGPSDVPVIGGAVTQSGVLPVLPQVWLGDRELLLTAAVQVGVGIYQFNLAIPIDMPDGDWPLAAVIADGLRTQTNLLVSVRR